MLYQTIMSENIPEKKGKPTDNQIYRNYSHKSAIHSMIPDEHKISTRALDIINDLVSYFFVQLKKNCYHLIRFIHAKKLTVTTVKHALPLFYFNLTIKGRNQVQEFVQEIDSVLEKWNDKTATNKNAPEDIKIMSSRIETQLKENMESFMLTANGIKAATIAVNYFAMMLLTKVMKITKKAGKKIITAHHIKVALAQDLALSFLFPNVAIMFGGINDIYEQSYAAEKMSPVVSRRVTSPKVVKAKTASAPKVAPKAAPKAKTASIPKAAPKAKTASAPKAAPKKTIKSQSFTVRHGDHTLDVFEDADGNRFLKRGKKALSPPYWPEHCPKGTTRKPARTGNCVPSTKKPSTKKPKTASKVTKKTTTSPKVAKKGAPVTQKKNKKTSPEAIVPIPVAPTFSVPSARIETLKAKIEGLLKQKTNYTGSKLLYLATLGARLGDLVSDVCAAPNLENDVYNQMLRTVPLVKRTSKFINERGNVLLEIIGEEQTREKDLIENAIQTIDDVLLGLQISLKDANNECFKYKKTQKKSLGSISGDDDFTRAMASSPALQSAENVVAAAVENLNAVRKEEAKKRRSKVGRETPSKKKSQGKISVQDLNLAKRIRGNI